MAIVLLNGYLLEGDATTASKVTYTISGLDGTTLTMLASGQLPNSKGTLYTAAGTDTIAGITLFNTNTTAEAVNLYVQDGTASRQIVGIDALGAGCHAQFDGKILNVQSADGYIQTTAIAHKTSHQDGGSDEVSVTGLSGLLADDQHVLDTEVVAVAIAKATMDADTVLTATTDDTPVATTLAEQTVLGRLTGGHPDDIAIGIADDNIVQIDQAAVADNDYAKFTAAGLEGRSYAEVKQDLDLEIGTDVLAQQTIGIADNNLLEVDDAAAADDDFARFTAAGIEGIPAQTALSALLAAVLLENDSIKLDPALSADGKWNGITETGTAGATLAFGDLVYLQTADSRWELASADNAAAGHNLKVGICVLAAAGDASATNMLLWGKVRADAVFPALTIGAPVYMGTTAGDIQVAAPSGTTDIVRIMGYANTADEIFFCPENDWIKLV